MKNKIYNIIVLVFMFLAFFCMGLAIGMSQNAKFKNEAIENGAAHYVVDKYGSVQFVWGK